MSTKNIVPLAADYLAVNQEIINLKKQITNIENKKIDTSKFTDEELLEYLAKNDINILEEYNEAGMSTFEAGHKPASLKEGLDDYQNYELDAFLDSLDDILGEQGDILGETAAKLSESLGNTEIFKSIVKGRDVHSYISGDYEYRDQGNQKYSFCSSGTLIGRGAWYYICRTYKVEFNK